MVAGLLDCNAACIADILAVLTSYALCWPDAAVSSSCTASSRAAAEGAAELPGPTNLAQSSAATNTIVIAVTLLGLALEIRAGRLLDGVSIPPITPSSRTCSKSIACKPMEIETIFFILVILAANHQAC
jgi:hypothetical protein